MKRLTKSLICFVLCAMTCLSCISIGNVSTTAVSTTPNISLSVVGKSTSSVYAKATINYAVVKLLRVMSNKMIYKYTVTRGKSSYSGTTSSSTIEVSPNSKVAVKAVVINKANKALYTSKTYTGWTLFKSPKASYKFSTFNYMQAYFKPVAYSNYLSGTAKFKILLYNQSKKTWVVPSDGKLKVRIDNRMVAVKNGVFTVNSSNLKTNKGMFAIFIYGKAGETLKYKIAAYNPKGQIGPYKTYSYNILPKISNGISLSKKTSHTYVVSWHSAYGANEYKISINEKKTNKIIANDVSTKKTNYAISNKIVGGKTYEVFISPYNQAGKGNSISATIKAK